MIVVDSSAVTESLIGGHCDRDVWLRMLGEELAAPDILDLEVASALRGVRLGRHISDAQLAQAVIDLERLPIERYESRALVKRALELRDNLTPYDASYVALAEALKCPLITLDRGIAVAPGTRCKVEMPGIDL